MKILAAFLFTAFSSIVVAAEVPTVTITESPNISGGTYTVSIGPNPGAIAWEMVAFAVTNDAANEAQVDRAGWGATLINEAQWNSGQTFSFFDINGNEDPLLTTGSGGVGSFDDVLGLQFSQAAVFWTADYFAEGQKQNTTASDYHWLIGPASSNALVLLRGAGADEFLSCELGNGSCVAASAVPLPAAFWLFVGAIGLIRQFAGRNCPLIPRS